ncbi:hypothetical protein ACHQM5_008527 [Ranunculus cassubicifolius]
MTRLKIYMMISMWKKCMEISIGKNTNLKQNKAPLVISSAVDEKSDSEDEDYVEEDEENDKDSIKTTPLKLHEALEGKKMMAAEMILFIS